MTNILLNGVLLPLMATWFIPETIRKNGYNSFQIFINLFIVFSLSTVVYYESKGWVALLLGVLNCVLVYGGGIAFVYFTNKKMNSRKK
jgi:hypothetical protein